MQAKLRKEKKEIYGDLMQLEIMEEINTLIEQQVRKRMLLNAELMKILDEEEAYWFKRGHESFLLKGDNNTDFFHKVANGRKRKQTIYTLQKKGVLISGTENLLIHATDYYKALFGPREGNAFDLSSSLWSEDENVTERENESLVSPFNEEEIKTTLFQMKKKTRQRALMVSELSSFKSVGALLKMIWWSSLQVFMISPWT
jgi:hypothetical protein